MNAEPASNSFDAHVYGDRLHQEIDQLIADFREATEVVEDPRFKALCETSAEVLIGLRTTIDHYARRDEPAWREPASAATSTDPSR
ncbi:MAG TPA: hypothetical protein VHD32_06770 [Candidatus Didemnitutus sp.]|nr:hypothetical protein [Candidatus Didemnitutus sp.]